VNRSAPALALIGLLAAGWSVRPADAAPSPPTDQEAVANSTPRSAAWPVPVDDRVNHSYTLFDLLEYQRLRGGIDAFRWSALGWHGGDVNRFWFKSEGSLYSSSTQGGQADVQALYGRLISPYFDFQTGVRVEDHIENGHVTRVFAVVALQGLSPYRFDLEPELFLSNKGKFSTRFTGTYEANLTQRWILQPRFEAELAFQKDEAFGVDRGVNDAEIGLRLRYEARREFAPYIGVSLAQSFGATKSRVTREGGTPNQLQFVIGLRWWR
jgi:copper resistance protein B